MLTHTFRFALTNFIAIALVVTAPASVAQDAVEEGHDHEEHARESHEPADEQADEHTDEHGEELADEYGEQGEEREDGPVTLDAASMTEVGIKTEPVEPGELHVEVSLPGEVRFNEDRLAHVVARLEGIVVEVSKSLGDSVTTGEVMAVLESRELANAKAGYLAALERASMAATMLAREEDLRTRKVSAEQDYLAAKQAKVEADIGLRLAEGELHALGFSEDFVKNLPNEPEASLTRYEVVAPFDGTIVERHVALGEVVTSDSDVFVVADLSTVWVDLSVYQKDLPMIREGNRVVLSAGQGLEITGAISYISPMIDESTRTALARVVLEDPQGLWRPGSFVTTQVAVEESPSELLVPKTAVQSVEGKTSVFVETSEGFEARPVVTGRADSDSFEILSGLTQGERIVTEGAFVLKAELSKGALSDGHNH